MLEINQLLGENKAAGGNVEHDRITDDEIVAEVITILDHEDPFDDSVIENYIKQNSNEVEAEVIEIDDNDDPDDDEVIEFYLQQKSNRASRTGPTTEASNKKKTKNEENQQQPKKKSPVFKCNLCDFKTETQTRLNLHNEALHTGKTI